MLFFSAIQRLQSFEGLSEQIHFENIKILCESDDKVENGRP